MHEAKRLIKSHTKALLHVHQYSLCNCYTRGSGCWEWGGVSGKALWLRKCAFCLPKGVNTTSKQVLARLHSIITEFHLGQHCSVSDEYDMYLASVTGFCNEQKTLWGACALGYAVWHFSKHAAHLTALLALMTLECQTPLLPGNALLLLN